MAAPHTLTVIEALQLFFEWAKESKLGPLQTVSMAAGITLLWVASRFVRSAKKIVGGVHHVYEQALEDQKKVAAGLRRELARSTLNQRRLLDELETERRLRQDLLRDLARYRAEQAQGPEK